MAENIVNGGLLNVPKESLGHLLFQKLKQHKNKIAQIDAVSGRHITFNDMLRSSCVLADNLRLRGLKPGDIIAIFSENRLEYIIPCIASTFIGTIASLLNPAYTSDDLLYDTKITKPKYIFCTNQSLPTVCEAIKKGLIIEELIIFDDYMTKNDLNRINCKYTLFSNLIKPSHPSFSIDTFEPYEYDSSNQIALLLRSSGTTGFPKGVKLSSSNVVAFNAGVSHPEAFGLVKDDIMLGLLPFFHGYGYAMLTHSIMIGFQVIILQRFKERLFLSTIEKYKITLLPLVPPILVFLAKSSLVNEYNLSSVKTVLSGAASTSQDTLQEVKNRLGFLTRQGYGMTELSFVAAVTPPKVYKPNSMGKILRGVEAKIIDIDTGKALSSNKIGELCFRGPYVMLGYFNNDQATRDTIDKHGWLHSGDIGYYDDDQYFYIVGRIKELIKYKAFQVAPAKLEALILTLSDVKDVAVIGLPDKIAGELPKAFVVKQPGSNITEHEIIQFVASNVAYYMKLRGGVEFIDEIPKTASGKILRRVLLTRHKSKL